MCEHFSPETVSNYQEGTLTNQEAYVFELHMCDCSFCRKSYVVTAMEEKRLVIQYREGDPLYIKDGKIQEK